MPSSDPLILLTHADVPMHPQLLEMKQPVAPTILPPRSKPAVTEIHEMFRKLCRDINDVTSEQLMPVWQVIEEHHGRQQLMWKYCLRVPNHEFIDNDLHTRKNVAKECLARKILDQENLRCIPTEEIQRSPLDASTSKVLFTGPIFSLILGPVQQSSLEPTQRHSTKVPSSSEPLNIASVTSGSPASKPTSTTSISPPIKLSSKLKRKRDGKKSTTESELAPLTPRSPDVIEINSDSEINNASKKQKSSVDNYTDKTSEVDNTSSDYIADDSTKMKVLLLFEDFMFIQTQSFLDLYKRKYGRNLVLQNWLQHIPLVGPKSSLGYHITFSYFDATSTPKPRAYFHLNPPHRPFIRSSKVSNYIYSRDRLIRLCSDILLERPPYDLLRKMYNIVYGKLPSFPMTMPIYCSNWRELVQMAGELARGSGKILPTSRTIPSFDSYELDPVGVSLVEPVLEDLQFDHLPKWLKHVMSLRPPPEITDTVAERIALQRKLLAPFEETVYIPVERYAVAYKYKFNEALYWDRKSDDVDFAQTLCSALPLLTTTSFATSSCPSRRFFHLANPPLFSPNLSFRARFYRLTPTSVSADLLQAMHKHAFGYLEPKIPEAGLEISKLSRLAPGLYDTSPVPADKPFFRKLNPNSHINLLPAFEDLIASLPETLLPLIVTEPIDKNKRPIFEPSSLKNIPRWAARRGSDQPEKKANGNDLASNNKDNNDKNQEDMDISRPSSPVPKIFEAEDNLKVKPLEKNELLLPMTPPTLDSDVDHMKVGRNDEMPGSLVEPIENHILARNEHECPPMPKFSESQDRKRENDIIDEVLKSDSANMQREELSQFDKAAIDVGFNKAQRHMLKFVLGELKGPFLKPKKVMVYGKL